MTIRALTTQQLQRLHTRPALFRESPDNGLGSPLLRALANAGRELLSTLITEQRYAPGQIIFKEGDQGYAMHIIWSGQAVVIKGSLDSPTILGYRGVGEIIGEMALIENRPRSASVVALEDVRLLSLTRRDFETLLSKDPTLGLTILSTLSARLRAADDARKTSIKAETQLTKQVTRLQSEKQQLMELNQLRQDTIDLIVHDLRHPISSLFGAIKILEMVLPEAVLEENKQLLDIANSNCDHLQLMVESLLDVAHEESGDFRLNLRPVDIQRVIEESIRRVRVLADMENIAMEFTMAADAAPDLQADEEKLHRILGNLLNNAIKFTPSGGKIIVMANIEGDSILISVADNGPGVPPEERKRIFERFTQLSGKHAKRGGFGLGLAFCKIAIEAHGGKIWVEPAKETGEGSSFNFTLPLFSASQND